MRKFYAGQGGALPPTDPRILSMTEQQIDIEFAHIQLDREARDEASGNKVYIDADYEREEEEESRIDSKLYMEDDFEEEDPLPKYENDNEGEWVDDEISDDDDF